ncbi:MAG: hypothetical protein IKN12_00145, partial [Selenomonadaceae bacterium]|nr:hypothetical protein [Selenomonadaceae bacterium]
MAVFPLLPRLSPDAPIAPVVSGDWEEAAGSNDLDRFLRGLAKGLDAPHGDKSIDSIDSIPDVWARPILFRMALFAANGFDPALHKKALGEWRAILAMLALQDMRHLSLTAEAVHLNDIEVNGALGQTLMTLAPHDSADGNGQSSWKDIYVISLDGIPFAITSPTTLVSTAADYGKALKKKLTEPWSSDGVTLTDPTEHLTPDELSGLHLWLKNLKAGLEDAIDADVQASNQTCAQLFNAIDNYMAALEKQAGGDFVAAGNMIPAGLKMHIGLFSYMDKMVQAPTVAIANGNTTSVSAVKILTSAERGNAKPLLLLDPDMLRDLCRSRGISPAQFVVWPGITAADVKNESLTGGRTVIGKVPIGNAEWRRPHEFFTDRLTVHAGGEVLKGAIKVPGSNLLAKEDMSIILPLKPEILEYFTPEEIAQRFRVEKIGNDIKVQFEFTLSGINGNSIDYQAEKIYHMQEVIYLINNAPVIEIWPNFKKQGWKRYYLYYENSEAQNQTQNIGRDFFYVYPWSYGENIAGDTPDRGLSNIFTSRLTGFPDALICTVNMTTKGGIGAEPIEAGIILLEDPGVASEKMGQSWQIGIDFGTSSTMLFYRNGANEPKPLDLQPNLFDVTNSGHLGIRTYRNFIPSSMENRQAGSFLSIFQLLNGTHLKGQIPNIRPLQDGNVFWLSTADGPDAEDFRSNSGQIDANLKWKGDQVGKLKVAAYIKQICLQSLAEAAKRGVGNISWNFSFPTAFSASQTMTFETTCKNAVNEGMKDSGMATGTMPVKPPEYWPESKACAYYFNKLGGVAFAGGAVCLDIGAGTTDISIISDRPARIVYH